MCSKKVLRNQRILAYLVLHSGLLIKYAQTPIRSLAPVSTCRIILAAFEVYSLFRLYQVQNIPHLVMLGFPLSYWSGSDWSPGEEIETILQGGTRCFEQGRFLQCPSAQLKFHHSQGKHGLLLQAHKFREPAESMSSETSIQMSPS